MNLLLRAGIALAVLGAVVGMSVAGADTVIRCGDVTEFTAPTAQAAGAFVIGDDSHAVKIAVPAGTELAALSGYSCVSVTPGTPAAYAGVVAPGARGYQPQALPATASTFSEMATSLVLLTTAVVLFTVLVVFASYGGAWGRRIAAPRPVRPYNDDLRQRPGGVRISHR